MKTTPKKSLKLKQVKGTKISQSSISEELEKLNENNVVDKASRKALNKNILRGLLAQIKSVDFWKQAGLNKSERLQTKHYLVCCIENILKLCYENNVGICNSHGQNYIYNGTFWSLLDHQDLIKFLGDAAKKMGVNKNDAKYYLFREQLFKQFQANATINRPDVSFDTTLINLRNGTFEISKENQQLRPPDYKDFLTYQLPFDFEPQAEAPLFQAYLEKVLPNPTIRKILAEYLGYVFLRNGNLSLEKFLLLYGSGANGKSVFSSIVYALLGKENVTTYSLQSLTNEQGYSRVMIENKLVNYSSEINEKLDPAILKQLASGEPIEARAPYEKPFIIYNYAKMIFNCNVLPVVNEHTMAFFRRFLIIPFNVTIPESEQDKELSQKIISNELSGVFNWVLEGLKRLIAQKGFTKCEELEEVVQQFKRDSDTVMSFLHEEGFKKSTHQSELLMSLFGGYKNYCIACNYRACSLKTFSSRIRNSGFEMVKKSQGMVVYLEK